jgi:hypothetical protein
MNRVAFYTHTGEEYRFTSDVSFDCIVGMFQQGTSMKNVMRHVLDKAELGERDWDYLIEVKGYHAKELIINKTDDYDDENNREVRLPK